MSTLTLPVLADGGLTRYLAEIRKFPMLSEEEEFVLAKAWADHNDKEAAEKMVTSHLRLVAKIASGYRGYGLPLMDLISEGNIGLMQAVKKFDPDKGFRLSTYAMWWIKASIQEFVLRSWSLVKIGTTAGQKKLFFNLRRVKNKISAADSNNLSPEEITEIAEELNVNEHEVMEMDWRMHGSDQSLNKQIGHDGESAEWMEFLEDERENQEFSLGESERMSNQKALLAGAMKTLNERERDIIEQRQLQDKPATLDDLSKVYNVSRERIRQIESRAMEKLQEAVLQPAA